MHPIITTYSGKEICPLNIKPEDIDIEDIIVAGSNICRFGGHLETVYSINAHQLLCFNIMKCLTNNPKLHFIALTHDICEIYSPIGDCLKPCKNAFFVLLNNRLVSINEYENYLQDIIIFSLTNKKFDYNNPLMKLVDKIALNTESLFLRGYKISDQYLVFNDFNKLLQLDIKSAYKQEILTSLCIV